MRSLKYKKLAALAIALAAGVGSVNPVYAAPEETAEVLSAVPASEETAVENTEAAVENTEATEDTNKTAEDSEAMAEEAAAAIDENDSRSVWAASRPSDELINSWVEQYAGKTVVKVETEGVSEELQKTLRVAIRTAPGDMFSVPLLERDMNRIYDTGYFYDLYPTFTEYPEGVGITYHVLETPIIQSLEVTGNSDIMPLEKIMEKITQKPGQHLNRRILRDNITNIQQMYVDEGYIMAKIYDLNVKDDGKLVISVNEGVLEGIKIKGNKKTHDKVIIREVRCKVGKPFNKNEAVRSYQRINNLNFFESVDLKPVPGVEPNAVVLEIDVKEKNTGNFGIGAGYSTSDGFLGMVSLGDSNFRGTGDAISVSYEFGGGDTDSHGWSFSYRHPWLDKKETSVTLKVYDRTFRYNDYDTNGDKIEEFMRRRKGVEVTFGRPQTEYTTNYITLRNREDDYIRTRSGQDRSGWADWRKKNFGLTRSIIFDHVTDTRDNYMYPMNGKRTSLSAEYAGFGGDFSYQKYTASETRFYQVGHVQVIAVRGEYGHANKELPDIAKYRVGGQDTVRGYRDDQFRGESMAVGNIEYRFPISKTIKGAIFTDFGGAWDHKWIPEHFKDAFHASVGGGISLDTPIGPLRLDIGHGSQGNRVHFTVGNTF